MDWIQPMAMKLFNAFAVLLLAFTPLTARAAQDGDAGSTSNAYFSISLSLEPIMEINTVSDIALNITDRNSDATFTKPFCVQGTTRGKYSLLAGGGSDGAGDFVLYNQNHDGLPYSVAYNGDPDSSRFDPLTPGVHSPTYSMLLKSDPCTGQTAFRITFHTADLRNAGSGLYTGALTLLVSPE